MLALVHLSAGAVADPISRRVLAAMAVEYRLVIVAAGVTPSLLRWLAAVLPGSPPVAVLMVGGPSAEDRALVEGLLADRVVPVVAAVDAAAAGSLVASFWLPVAQVVRLPRR